MTVTDELPAMSIEHRLQHVQSKMTASRLEFMAYSDERKKLIREAFDQGHSREDIGKMLGIPLANVYRVIPGERKTSLA